MVLTELAVFVVAGDRIGGALGETFARWSAEELVGPTAWVTPSTVQSTTVGPPRVEAIVVDGGETRTEDLFRLIGRHRLDRVRVVLGRVIDEDGTESDSSLARTASDVAAAIADALPQSNADGGHSTVLQRINLIAPVSGVRALSQDHLVRGWDVNAIVSPEDRPDADHANVFVRHPGNAVGHTATALAAAGGVFHGISPDVFTALGEEQSTSNGRDVVVVRLAVRSVVGDDTETRLTVRALEATAEEPHGPVSFVEWARAATDPDRVIADLRTYLLSREPWMSTRPRQIPRVEQSQMSVGAAIGEAAAFDARMFVNVPRWGILRAKSRIEDLATDVFVGAEADSLVRFNPASPEGMRASAQSYLDDIDVRQRRERLERTAASVPTADGRAWAALRTVAFAAVDGGELPAEIETPRYAGVREVLAPAAVVPDPDGELDVRGRTLAPSDALGADEVDREIAEALSAAQHALAAARTAQGEAQKDLDQASEAHEAAADTVAAVEAEERAATLTLADSDAESGGQAASADDVTEVDSDEGGGAPDPDREATSDEELEAVELASLEPVLSDERASRLRAETALAAAERAEERAGARLDDAAAAIAEARERADAVRGEQTALREWRSRISGSLLFQLQEDLRTRRDANRRRYDELIDEATADAPGSDDLVRAQKQVRTTWTIAWIVWAAVAAFVGLAAATTLVTSGIDDPGALGGVLDGARYIAEHWLPFLGIASFLLFVVLLLANHRYYLASRRYVRTVQSAVHHRMQVTEDVIFAGREAARLDHLLRTLTDWTEVIGQVLHRAHGTVSELQHDVDESVVDTLPAAFAVARANGDTEFSRQNVAQAIRLLFPRGWAATAFDHAHDVHRDEAMTDDPAGLIAADLDQGESDYGPRSELRHYWGSGDASRVLTRELVDSLRAAVIDERLVLQTRAVERLGDDADGVEIDEPEYFRGVATASTAFVSDVFADGARVAGKHTVSRSAIWLPSSARIEPLDDSIALRVGHHRSTAIRVDASRPLAPDDLVLFAGEVRSADEPSPGPVDLSWV